MSDSANISAKQRRAIRALLTNKTRREAAHASGVSQATLWRWFQIPAFAEAYREASALSLDGAVASLQAGSNEAVECLREVMTNDTAHVAARVSAARAVLEIALRVRELFEHEERIAEMEERIASLNPAPALRRIK